jgi:hypothetical protein
MLRDVKAIPRGGHAGPHLQHPSTFGVVRTSVKWPIFGKGNKAKGRASQRGVTGELPARGRMVAKRAEIPEDPGSVGGRVPLSIYRPVLSVQECPSTPWP